MAQFQKYQHIERFNTSVTDGLLDGIVYVYPKIDGTNASVWVDESGVLCAGSRNRKLSLGSDNAGFFKYVQDNQEVFMNAFLNLQGVTGTAIEDITLYGEWLVPHTLKTYRKSAWRKFYLFDVLVNGKYISFDTYRMCGLDVIPPLAVIENPTLEQVTKYTERNTYLIDGDSIGEGIVVKRYDFVNKFGRTVWGKIVRGEFKEKNFVEFGVHVQKQRVSVERKIIEFALTDVLLEKEFAKITLNSGWSSDMIPKFFGVVYYCLITEELWRVLKKYKSPVIDFKKLNKLTIERCKTFLRNKNVM